MPPAPLVHSHPNPKIFASAARLLIPRSRLCRRRTVDVVHTFACSFRLDGAVGRCAKRKVALSPRGGSAVRLVPPANNSSSGPCADQRKPAEFMLGVMGNSITIDRESGNVINLEVTTLAFDSNLKSIGSASQA